MRKISIFLSSIFLASFFTTFAGTLFASATYASVPQYVKQGSAVIDGNVNVSPSPTNEWDLSKDFYALFYEAGKSDKDILAALYMKYDCVRDFLYVLVLTKGVSVDHDNDVNTPPIALNYTLERSNDDNWIKNPGKLVDGSYGNDGNPDTAPDFSYINLANNPTYDGWEAQVEIPFVDPEMDYVYPLANLSIHAQISPSRTARYSQSGNLPATLNCKPTAIDIATFKTRYVKDQNDVKVIWESGNEMAIIGYNILRSKSQNGGYVKLNKNGIIPATGTGSINPQRYVFLDTTVRKGNKYFYQLEIVRPSGYVENHGVTIKVVIPER